MTALAGGPRTGAAAPLKGIACMVGGMVLLTTNDAIMKWLSAGYPIGEMLFLRGLTATAAILVFARLTVGWGALRLNRIGGNGLRAALVVASTFLFITSLSLMPLADAVAIAFAGPLLMTMLAALLLGERVGWRRWGAVVVGFIGVLVITRPTGEGLGLLALLPLAAALCGALRDIVTRRLSFSESSLAILTITTAAVTLSGLATLPFGWRIPTPGDIGLFVATGLLLCAAHYLLIETFRFAEVGLVAPFKYTSIIGAIGFGYLLWGDLPDGWTILGSALVVAGGLYIWHRELVLQRNPGS